MRNECFGRLSRSLRTRRALAGNILTCMPAGDSKNEPHQEKKPSFVRTHRNERTKAPAAPPHKPSNDMMPRAPFSAPRRSQGKTRRKKQQSKWIFLSLGRGRHFSSAKER
jgi:hypothetical protein